MGFTGVDDPTRRRVAGARAAQRPGEPAGGGEQVLGYLEGKGLIPRLEA